MDETAADPPPDERATRGARPAFRVRPVIRPRPEHDEGRAVSRDETDEGWGDAPAARGDDWYRRERPPHHGG